MILQQKKVLPVEKVEIEVEIAEVKKIVMWKKDSMLYY